MKKLLIVVSFICLSFSSIAAQTNPIIPGYHPDPSICRVGNDYYLVNSSFQYFPGVPIFHSTDLQHWEQIGNVLTRQSQLPLKDASSWLGIYAPTIRYHQGTYYMITTNVGNGGNFMVTASDPRGPWSEPIWLEQQGIDPSLLFEDGKCYMVSNPDNMITLCEIDPKTGRQLTKSRGIWQGTGGRYPEGPHIYKKDGYYYLLISEGGTELAHSITMARSRNIYGPYEANPQNPILTHCNMKGQSSQVQGTGHGDLVQGTDGRWWLTFLAYRNYNGSYHHLGRETFLAPVEWPDGGWPVVNGGEPVEPQQREPVTVRDDFDRPLGPEWMFLQNPDSSFYRLHDGQLRLTGSIHELKENVTPTFIGRRQEAANFTFDTKISFYDLDDGDEAGLCAYQMHEGYAQVCVNNFRRSHRLKVRLNLKNVRLLLCEKSFGESPEVWLRIESNSRHYNFLYSLDGQKYHWLESVDCSLLSTETVGGFTGVTLGLYAYNASTRYQAGHCFADFDYVEYREQKSEK